MLIAKENEIGRLHQQLDKQEKKNTDANKESEQLREQLKLSSDDHQLRRTIAGLNEQLAK